MVVMRLTHILQTLSTILTSFPKSINPHMQAYVMAAARHLTTLAPPFRASALNDVLENDFSLDTEDNTSLSLTMVLSTIMLFIADASRRGPGKAALVSKGTDEPTEILQQLVYLAIYYGQIPTVDEERWTSDVNTFVEDEDDEMPASTLRTATLDLVNSFLNSFTKPTIRALVIGVDRKAQESDKLRSDNQADWWKGYESALEHLSSVAEELSDHVQAAREKNEQPLFDIEKTFECFVGPFLSRPGTSEFFQLSQNRC